MIKEFYFEEALDAFAEYARAERDNGAVNVKIGRAVSRVLDCLNEQEERVVRTVYMSQHGHLPHKKRGAVTQRCAYEMHLSPSQVWRILDKARRMYAENAGLIKKPRKKSAKKPRKTKDASS